jgi:hypothetical protein
VGRRTGVPVREPFWDPDLIDLLVRVRPQARSTDGLAKALVRRPPHDAFPGLGSRVSARAGWAVPSSPSSRARRPPPAKPWAPCATWWDDRQLATVTEDALAGRASRWQLGWAWEALNLEVWARAHR